MLKVLSSYSVALTPPLSAAFLWLCRSVPFPVHPSVCAVSPAAVSASALRFLLPYKGSGWDIPVSARYLKSPRYPALLFYWGIAEWYRTAGAVLHHVFFALAFQSRNFFLGFLIYNVSFFHDRSPFPSFSLLYLILSPFSIAFHRLYRCNFRKFGNNRFSQ